MKYLLIVLFITGVAYGQDTVFVKPSGPFRHSGKIFLVDSFYYRPDTSIYFLPSKKENRVVVNGEAVNTTDNIYLIAPALFIAQQYDKYKKSLDSKYSKAIKDKIDSYVGDGMQFSVSYLGPDTVAFKYGGEFKFFRPRYVVRKHPSFEGFIEYLRRKQ